MKTIGSIMRPISIKSDVVLSRLLPLKKNGNIEPLIIAATMISATSSDSHRMKACCIDLLISLSRSPRHNPLQLPQYHRVRDHSQQDQKPLHGQLPERR